MPINLLRKDQCCGCKACYNVCPKHCIDMKEDIEGFIYPSIRAESCVKCDACLTVCPSMNAILKKMNHESVYAAVSKNKKTHMSSTSGGAFTEICKAFCKGSYSIYGCEISDDFTVRHTRITDIRKITRITRSKYVQSDIAFSYRDVKKDLDEGRKVIFSGTPCQVAALKLFLHKSYENLLTIDFVCHGVPNQKVFFKYINSLEKRCKKEIKSFEFRNKEYLKDHWDFYGSRITLENGKQLVICRKDEYYIKAFLSGRIIRPSCGSCIFASENRISDITLGDFHGISEYNSKWDAGITAGTSLIMINSQKGSLVFERMENTISYIKVPTQIAVKSNVYLNRSVKRPEDSHEVILRILSGDFIDEIKKLNPELLLRNRILRKLKRIVGYMK